MQVDRSQLDGVMLIVPRRFSDERGYFCEAWNARRLAEHGVDVTFVQDNQSLSRPAGTVRGLHFQTPPHAQAKLVRVLRGSILDVAVDIRHGSPAYGGHIAHVLSAEEGNQLFMPVGFAHGFCTLEPDTEVLYKVSDYYAPDHDKGILWNDPALGIAWPVAAETATVSEKDRRLPLLRDLPAYFTYDASAPVG